MSLLPSSPFCSIHLYIHLCVVNFILLLRMTLHWRFWCRQDNNLPHDSSLEPSSGAKMCYQNRLKSSLYSIKQSAEIILRGTKHRVSEVPQMSLQLFHKILLICMIPMV